MDDFVEVHVAGEDLREAAIALLDAADDPDQVRTIGGGFEVPLSVAVAAGYAKDQGAVETSDGVEHVGEIPASAAVEKEATEKEAAERKAEEERVAAQSAAAAVEQQEAAEEPAANQPAAGETVADSPAAKTGRKSGTTTRTS